MRSRKAATSAHGSGSCRNSYRPATARSSAAYQGAAIAICALCSCRPPGSCWSRSGQSIGTATGSSRGSRPPRNASTTTCWRLRSPTSSPASPLGEPERQQLVALGADLQRAWLHPAATAATRKRILRAALAEIVVRKDGAIIHAVLHWQGGDHTQLQVKQRLNAAGRHNPRIPDDTIALVRELARLMPDQQIARLLNRTGVETGHGNAWTQERVCGFRNHHDIAVFREGEWAERGEITLEAAAKLIGVCNMTALRMLRRGDIKGRQACAGAPWVIRAEDLAGFAKGKRRKPPLTQNTTQRVLDFQ